jgi:uncharacterized repeat protein (TIGR03803 family)
VTIPAQFSVRTLLQLLFRAFPLTFSFGLAVVLSQTMQAQTFSVLHNFTDGADGAGPEAGVTVGPGGVLYGTAAGGGTHSKGTVFRLSHSGSSWIFTTLYEFGEGTDGSYPIGGVVIGTQGALFGTTQEGGAQNDGTVYALTAPSTFCRSLPCYWDETILHSFTGVPDGINPWVEKLVFDGAGNIYGTTGNGGEYDNGTVFEMSPSRGGYTESILHSFGSGTDGKYPDAGVILDASGNLYGTTSNGGTGGGCEFGCGTAYQLIPSGGSWLENILVSFDFGDARFAGGILPYSTLIMDASGNLYGTTIYSSSNSLNGIVFKLAPSGGSFTPSLLYPFNSSCQPYGGVTMDAAGNLFGVCLGSSSVFELTNCGQTCTLIDLHDFNGDDGAMPYGTPTLDANGNLYGTTEYGGTSRNCQLGCGVVWEITGVGAPQKK